MNFNQNNNFEKIGVFIGFLFSYFFFSFIILLILFLLNKINNYLYIFLFSGIVTLIGGLIRLYLK